MSTLIIIKANARVREDPELARALNLT